MNMIPVDSSNLEAVGYESGILYKHFIVEEHTIIITFPCMSIGN